MMIKERSPVRLGHETVLQWPPQRVLNKPKTERIKGSEGSGGRGGLTAHSFQLNASSFSALHQSAVTWTANRPCGMQPTSTRGWLVLNSCKMYRWPWPLQRSAEEPSAQRKDSLDTVERTPPTGFALGGAYYSTDLSLTAALSFPFQPDGIPDLPLPMG